MIAFVSSSIPLSLRFDDRNGEILDERVNVSKRALQEINENITTAYFLKEHPSAMVESDLATSMEYFRVIQVDAPPFIEQGFEDGLGDWTISLVEGAVDSGTNWEAGVPTNGPGTAKTGDSAAGTGLTANYTDGTSVQLRTPVIDTVGLRNVKLSFSYFLEALEGEGGNVRLLEENGDFIQNLFDQPFTGGEDLNTADWTDVEVRLPNLDPPRPFIIEYQFLTLGDGTNGAGWFIDDVRVAK